MPIPEVSNGNNSIKKEKNTKKNNKRSTWSTYMLPKYTSSKTMKIRKDKSTAEFYMNKSKKSQGSVLMSGKDVKCMS